MFILRIEVGEVFRIKYLKKDDCNWANEQMWRRLASAQAWLC